MNSAANKPTPSILLGPRVVFTNSMCCLSNDSVWHLTVCLNQAMYLLSRLRDSNWSSTQKDRGGYRPRSPNDAPRPSRRRDRIGRTWPLTDIEGLPLNVRFRGNSGPVLSSCYEYP